MSPLLLLARAAALWACARLASSAAKRLGQPPVVGELAAGLALGPLVLGTALFPPESLPALAKAARVLLWLFLFDAGLETPFAPLKRLARPALFVSLSGILVPFALGAALGLAAPESVAGLVERRHVFALFMGTALAISAVPVIASILRELGLLDTELGALVMSAAVVDDAVGWTLLALCAALAGGEGPRWWAAASSAGPFLLGLAVGASARARKALAPVGRAARFLSPLFFCWAGLGASWTSFERPWWLVAFLAAACLGKGGGCYAGARAAGLEPSGARAVAAAMNARGAMELAAAAIGRSLGILDPEAYTIVIFIAAATTMMTPPLLRRWAGRGYLRVLAR